MSRRSGAWLLTAALLAACEPTIAEIPGAATSLAGATAGATAPPSGLAPAIIEGTPYIASVAPSAAAQPSAGATQPPTPTASPPPGYPGVVRLRGRILDEGGLPVAGATLRVRSLRFDLFYDRTLTAGADGAYQLEDVPTNVHLELDARKEGFTRRRRVATLPPRPDGHTVDFGAVAGAPRAADKTPGAPYFLSNRPEIAEVSPDEDDTFAAGGEPSFTLTLSEPLDATNRERLAAALRLMPASAAAVPAGQGDRAPDLREADEDDVDVDGPAGPLAWVLAPGQRFPADGGRPVSVSWHGDTEVTFQVPAALVASTSSEVRYQIGLVTPPDGARIEDAFFHQLGTDAFGDLNGYPPPGHLIRNAFRPRDLDEAWEDDDVDDAPAARWGATHHDTALSEMARDGRAPALSAVEAGRVGSDAAITLQFDEPLVAYDGSAAGHVGPGLTATADGALGLTFAVAADEAALADLPLDGAMDGAGALVDARAGTYLASDLFGRELAFVAESARAVRDGAPPGSVVVRPDPADVRRMQLLVVGRPFFFQDVGAIKVRVAGIGDPAGNVRSAAQADAEVRTRVLATPAP